MAARTGPTPAWQRLRRTATRAGSARTTAVTARTRVARADGPRPPKRTLHPMRNHGPGRSSRHHASTTASDGKERQLSEAHDTGQLVVVLEPGPGTSGNWNG